MHPLKRLNMSSLKLGRDQSIDDFGGCTVSGKGLTRGVVGQPTSFFVHTATLDLLYLNFNIRGPIEGNFEAKSIKSDIYCIEPNLHGVVYNAPCPGQYQLAIKWNGRDVHGSPFTVHIRARNEDGLSSDDSTDHERADTKSTGNDKL